MTTRFEWGELGDGIWTAGVHYQARNIDNYHVPDELLIRKNAAQIAVLRNQVTLLLGDIERLADEAQLHVELRVLGVDRDPLLPNAKQSDYPRSAYDDNCGNSQDGHWMTSSARC